MRTLTEAELRHVVETEQRNPAALYVPTGDQEAMIRAIGARDWGTVKIRTILAAYPNGCGKTRAWAMIIANIVRGAPQNAFFDYPVFRHWPFAKSIRIISNPTQLAEDGAVKTELVRALGGLRYTPTKDGKHYTARYDLANGWTVDCLSNNQMSKEAEGVTRGMIVIDEPCPPEFFKGAVTRLRGKGGIILIAATLIGTNADWIDEDLIRRRNDDDIIVLEGTLEGACRQHGIRGFREHSEIESMRYQLGDSNWANTAVRMGDAASSRMFGSVFPEFSPGVHVVDPASIPRLTTCTLRHAVDPHDAKPFAALWWATDKDGVHWVFAEWPDHRGGVPYHEMYSGPGVEGHVREFQAVEARYGITGRMFEMYIDGRFARRPIAPDRAKRTLIEILQQEHGRRYKPSNANPQSRMVGIRKLHDLLANDQYGTRPRLYIASNCHNLIRAFRYHKWTRYIASQKAGMVTNREDGTYKDFIDAAMIGLEGDPPFAGGAADWAHPQETVALPPGVRDVSEIKY